jgi:hypothetical protein
LHTTVTLYDLTNTYFEGTAAQNPKAARGRSKEKRTDCPLVTFGMVLDSSGFVRRSKMFAGDVAEGSTPQDMLKGLDAPKGRAHHLDAGIATEANLTWLRDRGYCYLAVGRERTRQFDPDQATEVLTRHRKSSGCNGPWTRMAPRSGSIATLPAARPRRPRSAHASLAFRWRQRNAGRQAVRGRREQTRRRTEQTPHPEDHRAIHGPEQEKSRGIGQHYEITVTPDETDLNATRI